METPEPGIYEDVPFANYLQWDALSNSRMSLLAKSPRHYKLGVFKETKPMQLGQLYHCGVLEPLAFAARYAIVPDFHLSPDNQTKDGEPTSSRTTKFVKERVAEFTAMCQGREIVPKEWYDDTLSLVRELSLNDDACRLLNANGPREVSILWDEDGILCKARLDKVNPGWAIADLKSTDSIDNFTASIGRYGYHRQMAHYQRGWHKLTGDTLPTWLIAVESSAPFAVQAAPMSEEAMIEGGISRQRLMDKLRDCLECDEWPGMPNPKAWNVPARALETESVELVINGQTIEV